MRPLLWLLFFALLASLLPALALSHGLADWIMADPATRYCCGPRDCHQVEVRVAPGGWEIVGFIGGDDQHEDVPRIVVPFDNVTAYSKRPGFWACFNTKSVPGGTFIIDRDNPLRCFFTPEAES